MQTNLIPTTELLDLHTLWFGELDDGCADGWHRRRWFSTDPSFDQLLVAGFATLPERAASIQIRASLDPREYLGLILALDQLPRNLFRGTARAFAYDTIALRWAVAGLDADIDLSLGLDERAFFRMPFMHTESSSDQGRSLDLFAALHEQTPARHRSISGAYLRSAQEHHHIISRFGRFPHRNVLLRRDSTAAELDWLQTGNRHFGQAPSAPS